MAFYTIVFIVIGFVIGLITSKEKNEAYLGYILISVGWFFVWGPFAIFTFVELIIGDVLARKIKAQKSTTETRNLTSRNIIEAEFSDITECGDNDRFIRKSYITPYEAKKALPKKSQTRLINRSSYNPDTETVGRNHSCSYDEWLRLGYQVKRGSKGYRRGHTVVFYRSQVVRKKW